MSLGDVIDKFHNEDSLADTSEDRVTTMSLGDVVDKFHNEDSLADTSTTEETDLTTLGIWGNQVDDLDTSFEDFSRTDSIGKFWGICVDGGVEVGVDWTSFVNWFTNDIDDTAESGWTDWDLDWGTSVKDRLTTDQTFGGIHSNGTDGVLSQMLGDFEDQSGFTAFDFKGVQNWWTAVCELDVNDWSNDGDDFTAGGDIRGRSNDSTEISRQHPVRQSKSDSKM